MNEIFLQNPLEIKKIGESRKCICWKEGNEKKERKKKKKKKERKREK